MPKILTRPGPTRPDPTRGSTRPVSTPDSENTSSMILLTGKIGSKRATWSQRRTFLDSARIAHGDKIPQPSPGVCTARWRLVHRCTRRACVTACLCPFLTLNISETTGDRGLLDPETSVQALRTLLLLFLLLLVLRLFHFTTDRRQTSHTDW